MVELIAVVKEKFADYSSQALENTWGHLYHVWESILHCDGSNQYDLPHGGVRWRVENGLPAVDTRVDVDEYNRCFALVNV